MYRIATFYEFRTMGGPEALEELRNDLSLVMKDGGIRGTIILAEEGFNGTVCGKVFELALFLKIAGEMIGVEIEAKFAEHEEMPFQRREVKIKPEIVTLNQKVNMSLGRGTHVAPKDWNDLIRSEHVVVLDARNDYEYWTGTFEGAVNPGTEKFSELPRFVAENLDPAKHKTIAMFCTGGIRCEKFAPYMRQLGFENVFQLEGGILRYLEEVEPEESLWQDECFVFDTRTTVDHELRKGTKPDLSQEKES